MTSEWKCIECGYHFNKNVPRSGEMKCPKCGSTDIDVNDDKDQAMNMHEPLSVKLNRGKERYGSKENAGPCKTCGGATYLSVTLGPICSGCNEPEGKCTCAKKNGRDNSYGNYSIWEDIKKGTSKTQIIKKIQERYDDIGYSQADGIYEAVRKSEGKGGADWTHYGKEK